MAEFVGSIPSDDKIVYWFFKKIIDREVSCTTEVVATRKKNTFTSAISNCNLKEIFDIDIFGQFFLMQIEWPLDFQKSLVWLNGSIEFFKEGDTNIC